ncbi:MULTISPECIES: FAD-binding oxidoreductase [Spirulina sp. CCY15215]|uniref:FAD-binding oxidoreductase n=1 Tax=Spirulina sp. CCY15215 TaxID=2767591 RepID=UPI001EF27186|nr:FAD-binding oxidoreductase [Spirulina major]
MIEGMEREIATALDALTEVEWVTGEKLAVDWQKQLYCLGLNLSSIAAVFPKTVEQLSQVVELAAAKQGKIIPCGNGSKLSWGGPVGVWSPNPALLSPNPALLSPNPALLPPNLLPPNPALLVSTQRLDRIIEHAVGDLTVTVEAGVKFADLQAVLQPTGQFLPLDPAYPHDATLGGIVATADSGSWRHRYGGVRDLLLGLSFVRGDGKLAKAGGRVVKNVAGYDLMKLFSGSYGSLGIISQLTFRTYPLLPESGTILLTGEADRIASISQTLLNSALSPTRVDLLSFGILKELEIAGKLGLAVQFASILESVKEQQERLSSWGEKLGLNVICDRQIWPQVHQLARVRKSPDAAIAKIGLLPSHAVNFLQELEVISPQQDLGLIHAGSGLGYLHLTGEDITLRLKQLREICQEKQGFLTILEAPIAIKKQLEPWGYTGNALELMRQIQQKFDRDRLFNSGRFLV